LKRFYLLYILLVFTIGLCRGQNAGPGSWNILNVKYNINTKWSLFGEAQIRSLKFYDNFHYYEYKGGVNYKVLTNVMFTLGAGDYNTYKEGGDFVLPMNNDEFRLWPQITIVQPIGKLKIEHRYRTEFRFTSYGYRNRYRYRMGISYPLGKEKNGYKPFQAGITDELFFTDKAPYFERNRLQLFLNYRISKITSFQLGYLTQFDYKINDETGRDFIQVGFNVELTGKKQKTQSQ
jgi:long-subunit fatty acid transport protein